MRPGAWNKIEPSRALTKERWKALYRKQRLLQREPIVQAAFIAGEELFLLPDTRNPLQRAIDEYGDPGRWRLEQTI